MNPLPNVFDASEEAASRIRNLPAVSLDDPRVIRAVEEYLASLETGPRLDRQELLARYPEIASALAKCLDGLEFVHRVAPQLSEAGRGHAPSSAPAIQPEGPLGDFRLVREVGRGGMGVVYEAVQISLGRRVALKVLPFAATMDPKQLQRFKNEAQAAAHLHHTNIVPVFGVGCERGVHYYAMQFIEGQTLAQVIADLRARNADLRPRGDRHEESPALAATGDYHPAPPNPQSEGGNLQSATPPTQPIAALSTEHSIASAAYFRTIANLGVQAAEALEYAHDQGVIHRDIKPANLLVDARTNLWITDFGLAHCQSQGELTMSGDLVGTLRYMSPEQALAKRVLIDHRTDVYSLGATLYELLTLEPVFTGGDRQELLRQIAFEEPRPLRRLNKPIPAELETIVQKALEKNPQDRYATAQELADDLRRFLEDKPIRARRPSLRERLMKWCRRHKPVVTSGVLLLIMAVLALAVSTVFVWREKDRATQRFELARRAVDEMYTQVAEEWLSDQPQLTIMQRQFLEKALAFYQEFAAEQSTQPAVQQEAAKSFFRVGRIQNVLGHQTEAEGALEQARALLEVLADRFPTVRSHRHLLATVYRTLGIVLVETGQPGKAEQVILRALDLRNKLVAESSEEGVFRVELAEDYIQLGSLYFRTDPFKAEKPFRQALELRRRLVTDFPHEPSYQANLGGSLHNVALLLEIRGDHAEAHTLLEQAVGYQQAALKAKPGSTLSRHSLRNHYGQLGLVQQGLNKPAEAAKAFVQAVLLGRRLVEDFPDVPDYAHALGGDLSNWAGLLKNQGELARARELLEEAIDQQRAALKLKPRHPGYRTFLRNHHTMLANLLSSEGRKLLRDDKLAEAEPLFQQIRDHYEKLIKGFPDEPDFQHDLAGQLHDWARPHVLRGRPAEALPLVEQAIRLQQAALEAKPQEPGYRVFLRNHYNLLASLRQQQHKPKAAEEAYGRALDLAQQLAEEFPTVPDYRGELARCHNCLGGTQHDLAQLYAQQGEWAQARVLLDKAIAHQQAALKTNPKIPEFRQFLGNHYDLLATALTNLDQFPEAERATRQEFVERQKLIADFPEVAGYQFDLASSHYNFGTRLRTARRFPEAEANCRKTLELLKELTSKFPGIADHQSLWGATLHNLAMLLARRGEWAEAAQLTKQAIEHQRTAFKASPQNRVYREYLCNHCVELAYYLSNFPDPRIRNPVRAIDLANEALKLDPQRGLAYVRLGEAYYRAGDWSAAVGALEKANKLRKGGDSSDWLFLAMAQWRLGRKEEARKWYDKAVTWADKHQTESDESRRFRAEAAALLGIQEQPPKKQSGISKQLTPQG